MGLWGEFRDFLYEYKVAALAIAFIMGIAVTDLVKSLVNDIIMPLVNPFIPTESWKEATLTIGEVVVKWGSFLSSLVYFLILALVVFAIAKFVLKEEKVGKK